MTIRLVDYVAIVGFDFETNQRNAKGRILQRFPEKDWPDTSFIDGIEFFCQPLGWEVTTTAESNNKFAPKFFQFVLTDIDVGRHYCACLTFYEAIQNYARSQQQRQSQLQKPAVDQQQQHQPQGVTVYAPKCIVLISRLDYKEVFKNCLSIFYTVHVDNLRYSLETLIGNLLTCIKVPSYGGPSVRFSLSAGDCLALQPPLTDTIPVTSTTVYRLIEHLGINNVVELFYALLTEHKILFYSHSYTRLNEACHGLISLMYPFKYSHTYIPVLPATLIEFLSTPTPFIIGVHSSLKREISDLLDVIVVDFDGGSVKVPDSLHVAHLEEPYNSQLITSLIHITRPQIIHADDAFYKSSHAQPSSSDIMDKEIRAIFLRTITQILQGYRSCLTVIRIHPKPLISFHKASFLGQRGFGDNEFMTHLLESMFFEKFVESRGLPHRDCDLFDELHASMHERLREENNNINATIIHIKSLAHSLWEHENPLSRPHVQKALHPSDENAKGILIKPFPMLDSQKISSIIAQETRKNSETLSEKSLGLSSVNSNAQQNGVLEASITSPQPQIEHKFVPIGLSAEQVKSELNANEFVINSARRLEVMRNCVNCIFDNKISDARKALPAVLKALKNKANRLALIDELGCHLGSQRAVLEHQQFDLVVRLMNCALQHESHIDLNGVAAKILPLAMEFCRRLCTGVIQFAFTLIQDHPVWSNQQFWESSFYLDVEKDIKALYASQNQASIEPERLSENSTNELNSSSASSNTLNKTVTPTSEMTPTESGLEVASKQLQLLLNLPESQRNAFTEKWSQDEESTVYSQAVHYANRIVCMKVPLDIATRGQKATSGGTINEGHSASLGANLSQRTHSNGSDRNSNSDDESGFEDEANLGATSNSEVAASVIKFVTRFVDKVCIDSCVGEAHIKALHTMIPQVVAMQIETLESVYRESKRLPPVMKPKITNPDLIEGEEILMQGLRTYLLPDGRDKDTVKDESISTYVGGPVYLPAEGAMFLTNYRIIFKGRPCDPFYCEQTVVRSFPTSTLTKEKRITVHAVPAVDQTLREGLQLRSNTFQLIRVAFDEEVTSESIDGFRKTVIRQRYPSSMFQLFAFTSQIVIPNNNMLMMQKTKNPKSATLKGFAKRTFMKTAQKAGLKKKDPNKNRLPAVVWRDSRNKAFLLKSSGFQAKNIVDIYKKIGQIYVMADKALVKSIKPEMYRSCEFIPLDLHEVRQVKNNFVKFLRICVPSAPLPPADSKASLAKTIEHLGWFDQMKAIIDTANNIVDLIDAQSKSVLLAMEDGWDLTPQITSVAQLCLDPYCRTFDGFKSLIEKEWLAFGHRISHKSNHTISQPTSGFTPTFIQFLDIVHQIHRQFPLSFEFNQYYLKFIAYHHVSGRFKTFLLECDGDRSDCGYMHEDIMANDPSHASSCSSSGGISSSSNNSSSNMAATVGRHSRQGSEASEASLHTGKSGQDHSPDTSNGKTLTMMNKVGASFWDYAEKLWNQSPIFFNYYYTPVNLLNPSKNAVLKPSSNIAIFKLWDYYTQEELSHGPSYDTEVFELNRQHQEELMANADQSKASKRRVVVSCYDCTHLSQPDGLTQLMGELRNIEHEYNLNSSQWSNLWSKIETSLPIDQ